jgi:hypothetical protein
MKAVFGWFPPSADVRPGDRVTVDGTAYLVRCVAMARKNGERLLRARMVPERAGLPEASRN